ncbi:PREDICTED: putative F-box/kelch-repeat protein At4g35120 [Camelina sativa]|uniref:F-box/kelch-repeat protein At4g35120 n=1 Tax=Camelina sativa TaxID=90675 RepID=A0ABM0ZBI7_CAMSA|nr:PREDICTED: putative F-box/kelch-repeat protein At4g35120 [Camelina sativa]
MDAKVVVEQPRQKDRMEKKRNNLIPSSSISSLPKLYQSRSWIGNTEPYLYICQRLPPYERWFLVNQTIVTNGRIKDDGLSLSPIAPSPSAPSKPSTVAVGFEIYQIGGTINDDKRPSSAVHVFDCRTHTWRDAPNMLVARKRAKSAFIDGKIFVIGGTKDSKSSSMNWAEVYDLKTQTWKPLLSPCDDAKVQLRRGQLYVNSKLKTYEYDSKQGFSKERSDWFVVKGLENFHIKCGIYCPRLANYCGKLVILREFLIPASARKRKSIWCDVIRLEKRLGFSGLEIWGLLEQSNDVLTLHISYKFLSCITL